MGTETPKPNRTRLIHLAEWLGAQQARMDLDLPSEWDQSSYLTWMSGELQEATVCGTACCIAGKVALEDGGTPMASVYGDEDDEVVFEPWQPTEVGSTALMVSFGGNPAVYVDEYAQEQLGLTRHQAAKLFWGSNDYRACINDIRRILSGEL